MANLEILDDKKTGFKVGCRTCGSQCATKATKEEAIAVWNNRKDF